MTDTLVAEPVQAIPTQALAAVQTHGGFLALAQLSDEEFDRRLAILKKGQERIRLIQKTLLVAGEDYGDPTSDDLTPEQKAAQANKKRDSRPSLYKPGAEKLYNMYQLAPRTVYRVKWGGPGEPAITVMSRTLVHVGDFKGPIVAVGVGACTSWEKKYRWRKGERACPKCGVEGALIKGKPEYAPKGEDGAPLPAYKEGGWLCWKRPDKGGCGATFEDKDPKILQQNVAPVENPDQHDLLNTIVKMAKKRSYVDGCLNATATSGLFSQDLEDMDDDDRRDRQPHGAQPTTTGQAAGSGSSQGGGKKQPPAKAAAKPAAPKPAPAPAPAAAPADPAPADPPAEAAAAPVSLASKDVQQMTVPELVSEIRREAEELVTKGFWSGDPPSLIEKASEFMLAGEVQKIPDGNPEHQSVPPKWLRYTLDRLRRWPAPLSEGPAGASGGAAA